MENTILDDGFSESSNPLENVRYAGFGPRLGAMLIDALILAPLTVLGFYNSINFKSLPLMLVISFASFLYKPYLEWKRSATFGKTAVGIKVVNYSMENIDLNQAIARYFPWVISFMISFIMSITLYLSPGFNDVSDFIELNTLLQKSPLNTINSIYSVIFLILVGSLIADAKKQGVHDKYAQTYCIKAK